jgi:ribosomal-protein-alanine N-acetyltransferase
MKIHKASNKDVKGFINCYLEVWKSLEEKLPSRYVKDQIDRASSKVFQERILSETSNPSKIILIAKEDTKTIGLAWGYLKENSISWLTFLGVSPKYRRRGIGQSLVTRFIQESRKWNSKKIILDTSLKLTPAIKLYEKMGFKSEGMIKNPYGLDLIVFGKLMK